MAEKSPSRQLARTLDSGRFYVQVDWFCKQSVGESGARSLLNPQATMVN